MRNVVVGSLFLLLLFLNFTHATATQNEVYLHVFYGEGCPHCAQLHAFIDKIKVNYPTLKVEYYEVYFNNTDRSLFENISKAYNSSVQGVPTLFINDKMVVGFNTEIGKNIENEIKYCTENVCENPILRVNENSEKPENILTIPLVITAALVDSINPCAFAVLIILMTAVLSIHEKKKALLFGISFTISIYISYLLMGLGILSVLQFAGVTTIFYMIVTILAFIVGILNIKDYFWYGKGVLMEIPISWRPKLNELLNSVTSPIGAFLVGFAVSAFELPCTGGPYIVILGLLAHDVSREIGMLYLLLYNLVFK